MLYVFYKQGEKTQIKMIKMKRTKQYIYIYCILYLIDFLSLRKENNKKFYRFKFQFYALISILNSPIVCYS
jgi:hypothetical protein